MFNNLKILFILAYFCSCIYGLKVSINDYCDEAGIRIYEELGYTPIFEDDSELDCPSYYDSSKYPVQRNKCSYKNKLYGHGETIVSENCGTKCTCNILKNGTQQNYCSPITICNNKNTIANFCCAKEVQAETTSDLDCKKFNGETVKFMIKDTCTECLCGKSGKPICRKKICDSEIWNADNIRNKCAALYPQSFADLFKGNVDKALCCPKRFICHEDSVDIKVFNDVDETAEQEIIASTIKEKLCVYGEKLYTKSYALNITYKEFLLPRSALCFCKIPPIFSCIDLTEF